MKLNDCVIKVMSKLSQRYLLLVLEQDCIQLFFILTQVLLKKWTEHFKVEIVLEQR